MPEWWEEVEKVGTTVIEQEKERWSGLYDSNGRKLIKPETPMGFDMSGGKKKKNECRSP